MQKQMYEQAITTYYTSNIQRSWPPNATNTDHKPLLNRLSIDTSSMSFQEQWAHAQKWSMQLLLKAEHLLQTSRKPHKSSKEKG